MGQRCETERLDLDVRRKELGGDALLRLAEESNSQKVGGEREVDSVAVGPSGSGKPIKPFALASQGVSVGLEAESVGKVSWATRCPIGEVFKGGLRRLGLSSFGAAQEEQIGYTRRLKLRGDSILRSEEEEVVDRKSAADGRGQVEGEVEVESVSTGTGEFEVETVSTGTGELGIEELKDVLGNGGKATDAFDEEFCRTGFSETISEDTEREDALSSDTNDNSSWEGEGDHLHRLFEDGGAKVCTEMEIDCEGALLSEGGRSKRLVMRDCVRVVEERELHNQNSCFSGAQEDLGGPGSWKPSVPSSIFSKMQVNLIPLKKNLTQARTRKKVSTGRFGAGRRTVEDKAFVGLCYQRRKTVCGKGTIANQ